MTKKGLFVFAMLAIAIIACVPDRVAENRGEDAQKGDGGKSIIVENGTTTKPVEAKESSIHVAVYVENSASMDGYVSGGSDLRDAIHSLLTNMQMSDLKIEQTNLFFINSQTITQGSDLDAFVNKITPDYFKKAGGKKGTTDIASIFKTIAPKTKDEIVVLVSDCIFSPGSGKDASEYLKGQHNSIAHTFKTLADKQNISVLIYQFMGKYNGLYYDKNDKPTNFNGTRPFYVWIIGGDESIKEVRKLECKLTTYPSNKCILTHASKDVNYAVALGSGYKVSKKDNHSIEKAKLGGEKGSHKHAKELTFTVNVDLSDIVANEKYLLDTANYTTNNDKYRVVGIAEIKDGSKFTHRLTIKATSNSATTLEISLMNNLPKWVYKFNDETGNAAKPSDDPQRTFGLKHLMEGAHDGFIFKDKTLCKLTININK